MHTYEMESQALLRLINFTSSRNVNKQSPQFQEMISCYLVDKSLTSVSFM